MAFLVQVAGTESDLSNSSSEMISHPAMLGKGIQEIFVATLHCPGSTQGLFIPYLNPKQRQLRWAPAELDPRSLPVWNVYALQTQSKFTLLFYAALEQVLDTQ